MTKHVILRNNLIKKHHISIKKTQIEQRISTPTVICQNVIKMLTIDSRPTTENQGQVTVLKASQQATNTRTPIIHLAPLLLYLPH